MKASQCLLLVLSTALYVAVGCDGAPNETPDATTQSAEKEYDVQGKVVAVGQDKKSVTLDHEEIPGLMKGMEMKFDVEEPGILEGIEVGDNVAGRLRVQEGDYTITKLKER